MQKGKRSSHPSLNRSRCFARNNIADGLLFDEIQYVPKSRVKDDQRLRVGDTVVAMSSGSKSVVGKAASLAHAWDGTFGAFCGVLCLTAEICARYFALVFSNQEIPHNNLGSVGRNQHQQPQRRILCRIGYPAPSPRRANADCGEGGAGVGPRECRPRALAKVPTILDASASPSYPQPAPGV